MGGLGAEPPAAGGLWGSGDKVLSSWKILSFSGSILSFFVIIFAKIHLQNFCSFKVKIKVPFAHRCTLHPAHLETALAYSYFLQ